MGWLEFMADTINNYGKTDRYLDLESEKFQEMKQEYANTCQKSWEN